MRYRITLEWSEDFTYDYVAMERAYDLINSLIESSGHLASMGRGHASVVDEDNDEVARYEVNP